MCDAIYTRIKATTELDNCFDFELPKFEIDLFTTKLISTYNHNINCDVTRDEMLQFLTYVKE